ncbi:MAG: hypothetical protein LBN08_01550 [Lactobacillales bacterium]|jgi:hypothetical protein|nr:hypothetical protein [Lactobacillales bacterium]
MDKNLFKIIFKRAGLLIVGLFALSMLITAIGASNGASSYNAYIKQSIESNSLTKNYIAKHKNDSDFHADETFYIGSSTDGTDLTSHHYANYKEANNSLRKEQILQVLKTSGYQHNTTYSVFVALIVAAAVIIGIALFATDTFTNFNVFLFNNRYKKWQIFTAKYLVGLVATIITFFTANLINFATYKAITPEHFHYNFFDLFPTSLNALLICIFFFSGAALAGVLFGALVQLAIFAVAVVPSFILFLLSLIEIISHGPVAMNTYTTSANGVVTVTHNKDVNPLVKFFYDFGTNMNVSISNSHPWIIGLLILLAASVVLFVLGVVVYSLGRSANRGRAIYAKGLELPGFIVLTIYSLIAIIGNLWSGGSGLGFGWLVVFFVGIVIASYIYIYGFRGIVKLKNKFS